MCGIAGILNRKMKRRVNQEAQFLANMAQVIQYRGPDDSRQFIDENIGLVSQRLSIVGGNDGLQPIMNEDKTLILIFNGEIYNYQQLREVLAPRHRFAGTSDGEVLLHLYEQFGKSFLNDVTGMFSFAIWDGQHRKLIIGRDRLGIKPIFYCQTQDCLIFGSEIKAILAHPDASAEFDWTSALSENDWQPSRANDIPSFFMGINVLSGGELLYVDLDHWLLENVKYWDLPQEDPHLTNRHKISAEYFSLLREAVHNCVDSDIDTALMLSGGIDSLSIASLAYEKKPVHTFSVLTESTLYEDAKHSYYASKIFSFSNRQVAIPALKANIATDEWRNLLKIYETPYCEPEHYFKYYLTRTAKAAIPNLKIMISGQGSDEFNGGYCNTIINKFRPNIESGSGDWELFMDVCRGIGEKERDDSLFPPIQPKWNQFLSNDFKSSLKEVPYQKSNSINSPWRNYLSFNKRNLQVYNLWHEDRTAAANSIENRVPFLDHRLVELCCRIPERIHKEIFWDKRILRDSVDKIFPSYWANRKKIPFYSQERMGYPRRMISQLLLKNESELIREAYDESRNNSGVLDNSSFAYIEMKLEREPESSFVDDVLYIVNSGLLAKYARRRTMGVIDFKSFKRYPAEKNSLTWSETLHRFTTMSIF